MKIDISSLRRNLGVRRSCWVVFALLCLTRFSTKLFSQLPLKAWKKRKKKKRNSTVKWHQCYSSREKWRATHAQLGVVGTKSFHVKHPQLRSLKTEQPAGQGRAAPVLQQMRYQYSTFILQSCICGFCSTETLSCYLPCYKMPLWIGIAKHADSWLGFKKEKNKTMNSLNGCEGKQIKWPWRKPFPFRFIGLNMYLI